MPQAVLRQKDIAILQKRKLRLRRILISAIANTIANKYDGARIWPWVLPTPESRLFDLPFLVGRLLVSSAVGIVGQPRCC